MDEALKLVEELEAANHGTATAPVGSDKWHTLVDRVTREAAAAITRLHAEIEALIVDDELKLVGDLDALWEHCRVTQNPAGAEVCAQAAAAITRLHAEIEALKSDVADLVRAGSDEATENARLREALKAIEIEATREGGKWVHMRRVIALQSRAALTGDLTNG